MSASGTRAGRRPGACGPIVTLCALACMVLLVLAGCSSTDQARAGSGAGAGTPPSASLRATPQSTPATVPAPAGGQTSGPYDEGTCNPQSSSDEPLAQYGDIALLMMQHTFFYTQDMQLPDGLPLAPYKLPTMSNGQVQLAQLNVNPDLLVFTACNRSASQSHTLQGISVRITALTPYAAQLNQWNHCDRPYSRSGGVMDCGDSGWQGPGVTYQVKFGPGTGVGTTQTAEPLPAPQGASVFPLPLPPGKSVTFGIQLASYPQPATYRFALGVTLDGKASFYAPETVGYLFAPVAHIWTGDACNTADMQAKIPPATNPPSYYLCPKA